MPGNRPPPLTRPTKDGPVNQGRWCHAQEVLPPLIVNGGKLSRVGSDWILASCRYRMPIDLAF